MTLRKKSQVWLGLSDADEDDGVEGRWRWKDTASRHWTGIDWRWDMVLPLTGALYQNWAAFAPRRSAAGSASATTRDHAAMWVQTSDAPTSGEGSRPPGKWEDLDSEGNNGTVAALCCNRNSFLGGVYSTGLQLGATEFKIIMQQESNYDGSPTANPVTTSTTTTSTTTTTTTTTSTTTTTVVDCVGSWTPFSNCFDGLRSRTFVHSIFASPGGRQCVEGVNGTIGVEACGNPCVGVWNEFRPCYGWKHNRTYSILQPASNNGKSCVHADGYVDTQGCIGTDCVGNWTSWSGCVDGQSIRTFVYAIMPDENGGKSFGTGTELAYWERGPVSDQYVRPVPSCHVARRICGVSQSALHEPMSQC